MKNSKKIQKRLEEYFDLNKGGVSRTNSNMITQKGLLAFSLPVLSVGTALGQCQGVQTINYTLPVNTMGFAIDVDGDMVDDFKIYDNRGANATMVIAALNGGEVLTNGNGSGVVENYSNNAIINGNNVAPYNGVWYLLYSYNNNVVGPWAPAPTYPTSGFIGIRQSNNYGFIQLTVNSGPTTGSHQDPNISILEAGLANGPGAINAGTCSSLLLPVELVSFSLNGDDGIVQLSWQTASEINNTGFEIQRSEDGESFRPLSFVEGKGTSYELNTYEYEDRATQGGKTYYYRLKQIDYDGSFEYSKILQAKIKGSLNVVGSFSPNPIASGTAFIDFETEKAEEWTASVFGPSGQLVHSNKLFIDEGQSRQELDFSELTAGLYFVKFENGVDRIYRKISIK